MRQKQIEYPEQLPEAIKKQQEENLNTERSLSIIEARLLQQAKNKAAVEQIAKELSEKQSVADRWAKLNKLIGSADGAKFKVIAQSYTLNLLLLHATNICLIFPNAINCNRFPVHWPCRLSTVICVMRYERFIPFPEANHS